MVVPPLALLRVEGGLQGNTEIWSIDTMTKVLPMLGGQHKRPCIDRMQEEARCGNATPPFGDYGF